MADTAINTEEEKREYFDSPEELELKIDQLVSWIKESSQFIAFTGAGVSTSAGIPDFRSGYNTVLDTGPGAWEELKQNQALPKPRKVISVNKAIPSPTHMSLVQLMNAGLLKYLVSQNCDGLHRRSGIPPNQLAELHGNSNLEICKTCGKEYMRDFDTRNAANHVFEHATGRLCDNPACQGQLYDTIINFGEQLDNTVINNGFQAGQRADLCLAMGSSLRVTPAADIPGTVGKSGNRLVIVNLQQTPLDAHASLIIHAMCDTVLEKVMQRLNLAIPRFKLRRQFSISKYAEAGQEGILLQGLDSDNTPYSLFPQVSFAQGTNQLTLDKEPFKISCPNFAGHMEIRIFFAGHYGEPSVVITVNTTNLTIQKYECVFDPFVQEWETIAKI